MKEATGDATMTIIVIVLAGLVLVIGRWLLGEDGPLRTKIEDMVDETAYVEVYNDYNI